MILSCTAGHPRGASFASAGLEAKVVELGRMTEEVMLLLGTEVGEIDAEETEDGSTEFLLVRCRQP
jgi:hypothetical protein